jgi:ubiquinone/menaquinone biosynthesis C-methylase UbiE
LHVAADLLCCPVDSTPLLLQSDSLCCGSCAFGLTNQNGVLLQRSPAIAIPDTSGTMALRLMHSSAVVRVYDSLWRPILVHLASGIEAIDESRLLEDAVAGHPEARVLDLCCGTTVVGRTCVAAGGVEVVGIDASMEMLRRARRFCPSERLVLICADATLALPCASAFDVATCFAALHLLQDPYALLQAAARALKPGGVLLTWVLTARGVLGTGVARRILSTLGVYMFEADRLPSLLERAGFSVARHWHRGAIELAAARKVCASHEARR